MPTVESVSAISHLSLIQAVDNKLNADDPHKLSPWLRRQVDVDLAALEASDQVASTSELTRGEKSAEVRESLGRLEELVRDGYRGIGAIRSSQITDEERAMVYADYGWNGGTLGRLSDDRIVALARIGVAEHPDIDAPYQYPDDLITDLKAALLAYHELVPEAKKAQKGTAVRERNETLTAAEQTLSQVRYWYYAASRLTVRNPNLANIGFHPRRKNRTKEEIEEAAKRQEEKRQERDRKALQKFEEQTERSVERLESQIDRLMAKRVQMRTALGLPPEPESTTRPEAAPAPDPASQNGAGELPLSS